MRSEEVVELYQALDKSGVAIWIDGGWAVDAVVGSQTRSHNDLDIAVEAQAVPTLRHFLEGRGYRGAPSGDASKWNYVLAHENGQKIDVHVVVLDVHDGVHADAVDGIAYPADSLTGSGVIAGASVRCVRADFLLRFKTSYPPREIDRQDVAFLCAVLGCQVPDTHK